MNRLYAALALVIALAIGYGLWERHIRAEITAEFNLKIQKQKAEALDMYEKALAKGKKQTEEQEVKDTVNEQTITILADKLHVARLRDPNAGRGQNNSPSTPSSNGSGQENTTEASGLLSTELTGLLQRLTSEADEINNAYISCRADAYNVRKLS